MLPFILTVNVIAVVLLNLVHALPTLDCGLAAIRLCVARRRRRRRRRPL